MLLVKACGTFNTNKEVDNFFWQTNNYIKLFVMLFSHFVISILNKHLYMKTIKILDKTILSNEELSFFGCQLRSC